jgi:hypothetical protein
MDIAGMPPFRRATSDLSSAQIRRAIRAGDLIVMRRGVFVGRRRLELAQSDRDRHLLRLRAAALGVPGPPVVACLGSAALLHGFARLGRHPQRVRLYRSRGGPWRDADVAVLVCGLPPRHVTTVDDVAVTAPARTVVDLGRWVSFRSGVVVADSALRAGVTRRELEAVAADCARWPGIRGARQVIAFANGLADSPLESISRVVFAAAGLPVPRLQVPIGDPEWPDGIVDFFWAEYGVIGEADGLLKYDDAYALRAEKLRQEALEARGYVVVRWTWDDIWRRPEWVVERLRRAMSDHQRRRTA